MSTTTVFYLCDPQSLSAATVPAIELVQLLSDRVAVVWIIDVEAMRHHAASLPFYVLTPSRATLDLVKATTRLWGFTPDECCALRWDSGTAGAVLSKIGRAVIADDDVFGQIRLGRLLAVAERL